MASATFSPINNDSARNDIGVGTRGATLRIIGLSLFARASRIKRNRLSAEGFVTVNRGGGVVGAGDVVGGDQGGGAVGAPGVGVGVGA